ncbi:hypothetical protein phytr_10630 [Candidatus Phycorickettsia trachydisci]|uniref:Uncharacterized protein n=1 Tax=Candidatus Phycorickettsia trachydisci TaxID=2115978 RepID=A0A2P1P9P4_9RICK|nr:hypothetical protein [Candidatus Phycorickettsia trachydisci]AVP87991.1 hypothetical protein phytr_10630 [Candidatus Phycorickettsia trachydisci]
MRNEGEQGFSVNQLLNFIIPSERDQDGQHVSSSVEPRLNGDKEKCHLDCLARLMTSATSNEKCVAVCERGDKLLVASNSGSPEYAATYISQLQSYLNDPSEKYEMLELEAKKQISDKIKKDKVFDFEINYEFLKDINSELYGYLKEHNKSGTTTSLDQIIGKCSSILSLSEETSDLKIHQTASNIIRPLIDTQVLINQINKTQNLKIRQVIQAGEVDYVEGERGKHAEVKISDRLYDTRDSMPNGEYYIGITKLTCGPCDMALETFAEATGKNIKLSYAGTHGGTYSSWQIPKWITPDNPSHNIFVGKLNQILASDDKWDKAPEATAILKEDVDLFLENFTRKVTSAKEAEVDKGAGASGSIFPQPKEDKEVTLEASMKGGDIRASSA